MNQDFEDRKSKRVRKVLNYLKIDKDEDIDSYLYFSKNHKDVIKICEMAVDKQAEIFLKTGVYVSTKEILKKAILRGLRRVK